jgi:hypothetical protein
MTAEIVQQMAQQYFNPLEMTESISGNPVILSQ